MTIAELVKQTVYIDVNCNILDVTGLYLNVCGKV